MMRHEAIYALYPNVVCINDELGAFDKDGKTVIVDEAAVTTKAAELQTAYDAAQQAAAAAKTSALAKLAALGLTPAEITALTGAKQ